MAATIPANPPGSARAGILVAGLSVFAANMALLVLQLVAPRQLAPAIGSSLETWTTIIGVFLAGIAIGNWLGGKIADRSATRRALGMLLALGGVTALVMVGLTMLMDAIPFYQSLPLGVRIPLVSTFLCLLPSICLSLITPVAIKIALPDIRHAGRIAGLMFALSTLGCLIGNYLTGFILIAAFNVNTIAIGVAASLFVLAILWLVTGDRQPLDPIVTNDLQRESTLPPADDGPPRGALDLRGRLPLAFSIVFIASFCGMTLELTGFRHLAPHLGVSLYTWTGIIGVMLAATATGNYVGGILADRGFLPAVRFGGSLIFGLLFAAASHDIGREILNVLPGGIRAFFENVGRGIGSNLGSDALHWGIRFLGFLGGLGIVRLGMWLAEAPGGLLVWAGTVCGLTAPMIASGLSNHFPETFTAYYEITDRWTESLGFRVEPWTTRLVGVLIGVGIISLYHLGKKLYGEERISSTALLGGSLILGSLTTVAIVMMTGVFTSTNTVYRLPLVEKVLAWTFGLFFLPMFFLGTVSPQVIRLSVNKMEEAGRTAGSIYAWSTVGAIVGTFATGYFLISLLGTIWVLTLVASALLVLGVFHGRIWSNTPMLFAGSIAAGAVIAGIVIHQKKGRVYDLETNYYAIRVSKEDANGERVDADDNETEVVYKNLSLDRLLHSVVNIKDPTYLYYTHEHVQVELVRGAMANGKPSVLVIGGGGYTFPRFLEVMFGDKVGVDVVEIDPGVTEIAHRELGLPRDTAIRSMNMDGRQYVVERAAKGSYDLVIQDAVNDLSVPYHLMTKQYNDAVKAILKPDGLYLLTIIDSLEEGKLWRAAVHTMRETFPHVVVLGPGSPKNPDENVWDKDKLIGRSVYVILGSTKPLDPKTLQATLQKQGVNDFWTRQLPNETLDELLKKMPKILLTDQFAPVDNLMADVFRKREGDKSPE